MVNVYLPIENRQILALSIHSNDLERFSVRPVKWLRFVTFAVCGVRGDLSMMPNGLPVDYDNISLDQIAEAYYYTPEADYHFIDHNVMNERIERITSSEQTERSSRFRSQVMERDGPVCVLTRSKGCISQAVHLLPKCEGDEYIQAVFQDRLHLYDSDLVPTDLGIDSVENGLFLRADLHLSFAHGLCAFLKTPNFALDPADIPWLEAGCMPSNRITLHQLEPDTSHYPVPQFDVRIAGTAISPPSPLILDYMYGVAAYRRWGSGKDIKDVMQQYHTEYYEAIPVPPASPHPSHSPKRPDGMLQAMDDVLALSMLFKGLTPESMARESQRQEEAAEKRAKEASRVKVQEWMQSSSPTGS